MTKMRHVNEVRIKGDFSLIYLNLRGMLGLGRGICSAEHHLLVCNVTLA